MRPDPAIRLQRIRDIQRWLDSAFRLPGTTLRVGWDPIIGLIPWAGDVVTAVLAFVIILEARRSGAPRLLQLRMLFNVAFDLLMGVVPFVGDVADFFWKSNTRNLALLERHLASPGTYSRSDWVFLLLLVATLAVVALFAMLLFYSLARLAGVLP